MPCVMMHFYAVKIVSALLSFNGITHPYFVKLFAIVKIYLNFLIKVWKKNYVSLVSFSLLIRFNRFYFYIFSWFKKKTSFNFSTFNEILLFVFENHLRVSSFWKSSVLFICYSFMILSQILILIFY